MKILHCTHYSDILFFLKFFIMANIDKEIFQLI